MWTRSSKKMVWNEKIVQLTILGSVYLKRGDWERLWRFEGGKIRILNNLIVWENEQWLRLMSKWRPDMATFNRKRYMKRAASEARVFLFLHLKVWYDSDHEYLIRSPCVLVIDCALKAKYISNCHYPLDLQFLPSSSSFIENKKDKKLWLFYPSCWREIRENQHSNWDRTDHLHKKNAIKDMKEYQ